MRTFVLYKNEKHEYKGLDNPVFIYTKKELDATKDLNAIKDNLIKVLDSATPGDLLVLNGPSYLSAIGGYVWFSNDKIRDNYDIVAYDPITRSFKRTVQEFIL